MIDFSPAVADKTESLQINPIFNDGDKLHPSDAGYQAMTVAIDLRVVTGM